MNEQKMKAAYDSLSVTPEQKRRMLNHILEKTPAEKSKYQAAPTESRILPVLVMAAVLILVVFSAIHYLNVPENSVQLSDPTQTENIIEITKETRVSDDRDAQYDLSHALDQAGILESELETKEMMVQILLKYDAAIEEAWEFDLCEAEGISYISAVIAAGGNMGYAVTDLDGNGTSELIISDGKQIYDLYTAVEGELMNLLSADDSNTYELCEGGYIRHVKSEDSGSATYQYFKLSGTELLKEVSVAYEKDGDIANWYLYGGFQYSIHRMQITQEEAENIMGRFKITSLEIIPFP